MTIDRAVAVLAIAIVSPSAVADDRFEFGLEWVTLSGPGAQLDDPVDRRVKGVDTLRGGGPISVG